MKPPPPLLHKTASKYCHCCNKRRLLMLFILWVSSITLFSILYFSFLSKLPIRRFVWGLIPEKYHPESDRMDFAHLWDEVYHWNGEAPSDFSHFMKPSDADEPVVNHAPLAVLRANANAPNNHHDANQHQQQRNNAHHHHPFKQLTNQNIFLFGANTYTGYQISRHFQFSHFNYKLTASFDVESNLRDPYRFLRRNHLKELVPGRPMLHVDGNLCATWSSIKDTLATAKFIIYAEDTEECLHILLSELREDQVLIVLRHWKHAYFPQQQLLQDDASSSSPASKKDAKPDVVTEELAEGTLSEDKVHSLLSNTDFGQVRPKCRVVELVYSNLIGYLSWEHAPIGPLHNWAQHLTERELFVRHKSEKHGDLKRDYLHHKDLANAVHLTCQAIEEGKIKSNYEIINLASGHSVSDPDLETALRDALKLDVLSHDMRIYRSNAPVHLSFDVSKAKELLSFEPILTDYKLMVSDYGRWYREFFYPSTFSMTTLLSAQGDPQRRGRKHACRMDKMEDFYASVHLVDVTTAHPFTVFIFHDDCPESMVSKYETPYVRFYKLPNHEMNRESPNDERFYLFYNFLLWRRTRIPSENYVPTHALWTDLFDVWFNKNPFDFMRQYEAEKKQQNKEQKYYLYPGKDHDVDRVGTNGWLRNRAKDCRWTDEIAPYKDAPFMNAGVCGGQYESLMRLVRLIGQELNSRPKHHNCNMPAYNLVLNKYFGTENYWHNGPPFTSPFWKKSRDPKYFICHK